MCVNMCGYYCAYRFSVALCLLFVFFLFQFVLRINPYFFLLEWSELHCAEIFGFCARVSDNEVITVFQGCADGSGG